MKRWLVYIGCAMALLLGSGCSETVDPTLGTEQVFSVYGFLNPQSDTQVVRVFAIEDRLVPTEPLPIDAQVTSTDLQAGTVRAWQDSLVHFEDNTYGHVFWASFAADYEHTYRLEVARSDGEAAVVEVTVPPVVEPEVLPPDIGTRRVTLPVYWADAPRLNQIEVVYRFQEVIDGEPGARQVRRFQHNDQLERRDRGWVVTIPFFDDGLAILREFGDATLNEIALSVLVSNEAWRPPSGFVYDPEVLVEPGTFTNVEQGFGFVGAGYPDTVRWLPPPEAQGAAGFRVFTSGE